MKNISNEINPINVTQKDSQNIKISNNDLLLNEKLVESEMRYRRLFESAKDGILILDFETGQIVDANPFIVKMIDYPLEEIIGKKLWEIGLFINREESETAFNELKINGYIRYEDRPIKRRNGKIKEVEFISNVYNVNDTKVIQCNIRDISGRKYEERKQELNSRILSILNVQNNWKKIITDILNEIRQFTKIDNISIRLKEDAEFLNLETTNSSGYCVQAKEYLRRRDYKSEISFNDKVKPQKECICCKVILGNTDPSLPYYTKGGSFYTNLLSELLQTFSENEKHSYMCDNCNLQGFESVAIIPLFSGKNVIGQLQLKDTQSEMISLELIEFFENTGNSIGIAFKRILNEEKIKESEQRLRKQNKEFTSLNKLYIGLNEELTESIEHMHKINNELVTAKAKAEESDKLKTAFLANMSHEIRTPMNAIMGFSGFLLEPDISKENQDDFIHIINSSSQQLLSIISDIIDISKIESGQIIIEFELVNINKLLGELLETYNKEVKYKKINLLCFYDRPNDTILVKTDGNRLKQILCNLLNNAIKFTSEGVIEFGYFIKNDFVEFYVKDTGIGITSEHHELIFQRFRQVEKADNHIYGGNGLGLSISKALAEKLGGFIKVDSELGVGSTFTCAIPYAKGIEENTEHKKVPNKLINWNEKTILIAEDDQFSHAFIKELLSPTNVKMLHALDGREAVELVKNHPEISLVLMDIKMPIMNGYEAMRIIKEMRPELPIIAQTAYALSHDKSQALQAGFDRYISKPIKQESLIELIVDLLK